MPVAGAAGEFALDGHVAGQSCQGIGALGQFHLHLGQGVEHLLHGHRAGQPSGAGDDNVVVDLGRGAVHGLAGGLLDGHVVLHAKGACVHEPGHAFPVIEVHAEFRAQRLVQVVVHDEPGRDVAVHDHGRAHDRLVGQHFLEFPDAAIRAHGQAGFDQVAHGRGAFPVAGRDLAVAGPGRHGPAAFGLGKGGHAQVVALAGVHAHGHERGQGQLRFHALGDDLGADFFRHEHQRLDHDPFEGVARDVAGERHVGLEIIGSQPRQEHHVGMPRAHVVDGREKTPEAVAVEQFRQGEQFAGAEAFGKFQYDLSRGQSVFLHEPGERADLAVAGAQAGRADVQEELLPGGELADSRQGQPPQALFDLQGLVRGAGHFEKAQRVLDGDARGAARIGLPAEDHARGQVGDGLVDHAGQALGEKRGQFAAGRDGVVVDALAGESLGLAHRREQRFRGGQAVFRLQAGEADAQVQVAAGQLPGLVSHGGKHGRAVGEVTVEEFALVSRLVFEQEHRVARRGLLDEKQGAARKARGEPVHGRVQAGAQAGAARFHADSGEFEVEVRGLECDEGEPVLPDHGGVVQKRRHVRPSPARRSGQSLVLFQHVLEHDGGWDARRFHAASAESRRLALRGALHPRARFFSPRRGGGTTTFL